MTRLNACSSRGGFALLAVLWVMVGAVALALVLSLAARDATGAAQNRVSLTRASWSAEGCAERVRAAAHEAIRDAARADSAWGMLDSLVRRSPIVDGCHVLLQPNGVTLDVNAATWDRLQTLMLAAGLTAAHADSLADALLDWSDADDDPRADGAEHMWYRRAGRPEPRNAPFANQSELRLVRGMDALAGVDSLLGVEPGAILLSRAPLPVLATLPGFSAPVLAHIAELRTSRVPITNLVSIESSLDSAARRVFLAHHAELVTMVSTTPDTWLLTSQASDGEPSITVEFQLRLALSGRRIAIVERRSWP